VWVGVEVDARAAAAVGGHPGAARGALVGEGAARREHRAQRAKVGAGHVAAAAGRGRRKVGLAAGSGVPVAVSTTDGASSGENAGPGNAADAVGSDAWDRTAVGRAVPAVGDLASEVDAVGAAALPGSGTARECIASDVGTDVFG